MIYPASYDITILQNSTWRGTFRATQNRKEVASVAVLTATPTFTVLCHGYSAGDKVIFTGGDSIPCGLDLNEIYYVIAAGLTTDAFQVSATNGGSSISIPSAPAGTLYVAVPVDLTATTIDADIKGLNDNSQAGTFTPAITDAVNGKFTLTLSPSESVSIEEGRYGYDISITQGSGDRYYWLTGVATVQRTYSRN
jgi:hypothetical protein